MVQLAPNLAMTLKNLAGFGAVISAEQQAALDHSLPIKRTEAGLKSLTLWGKITTQNGKDYLLAEGSNEPLLTVDGHVQFDAKYYFSLDGVKWVDLQAIDQSTSQRAAQVKSTLIGDPAKAYEVVEDDPNAPPAPTEPAEGEEAAEGPKKLVFQIPELAVLRYRLDSINTTCGVIPVNSVLPNAMNRIVSNRMFPGISYPEKLESYTHRNTPPSGPTLAADLRGTWSVNYDPFKQISAVRSLLYPGYTFYYAGHDATWGAMYVGDGNRNDDLIFML
ncbi:hypothetical protein CEUSTIGMA_g12438.t1 [Chlamydomonas eustigma]|uniref:Radial spoke head protein 9 homolog n=1 Tax=Chlamydomonas eustigma TaxID=1157962 RepID=A0A250XPL8_9CHLO|nr:hypothetical protein CEUSTIGMA_g12438.t1 [Chlamydomonas eustigma]|eukprot:GAX85017.1 hypothetical protein CEUSTIGMA_g12438.t1 [Chlamydomonas eustigma]